MSSDAVKKIVIAFFAEGDADDIGNTLRELLSSLDEVGNADQIELLRDCFEEANNEFADAADSYEDEE